MYISRKMYSEPKKCADLCGSVRFGVSCSDAVAGAEPSDQPSRANAEKRDGFPPEGTIAIGPYSVLVFSQDPIVKP